jgi:hypothetical protein
MVIALAEAPLYKVYGATRWNSSGGNTVAKDQEQTETSTGTDYGFGIHPDAAGAPGLENADLLDNYWDGNLSLPEAQVLDIITQALKGNNS